MEARRAQTVFRALVLAILLAGPFARVHAQSAAVPARDVELAHWTREFTAWQQWWAEFANRPEPGWITLLPPRRIKPDPPAWLAAECDEVFDASDSRWAACALLADWRLDNATALTRASGAINTTDQEPKTIWWEHVHMDVLWPATEVRLSAFGVIGMHT